MKIGVNNKAHKIIKAYVGVNNIARKIKKAYIGNDMGQAVLCYENTENMVTLSIYSAGGNTHNPYIRYNDTILYFDTNEPSYIDITVNKDTLIEVGVEASQNNIYNFFDKSGTLCQTGSLSSIKAEECLGGICILQNNHQIVFDDISIPYFKIVYQRTEDINNPGFQNRYGVKYREMPSQNISDFIDNPNDIEDGIQWLRANNCIEIHGDAWSDDRGYVGYKVNDIPYSGDEVYSAWLENDLLITLDSGKGRVLFNVEYLPVAIVTVDVSKVDGVNYDGISGAYCSVNLPYGEYISESSEIKQKTFKYYEKDLSLTIHVEAHENYNYPLNDGWYSLEVNGTTIDSGQNGYVEYTLPIGKNTLTVIDTNGGGRNVSAYITQTPLYN